MNHVSQFTYVVPILFEQSALCLFVGSSIQATQGERTKLHTEKRTKDSASNLAGVLYP